MGQTRQRLVGIWMCPNARVTGLEFWWLRVLSRSPSWWCGLSQWLWMRSAATHRREVQGTWREAQAGSTERTGPRVAQVSSLSPWWTVAAMDRVSPSSPITMWMWTP